ncbi:hypothetical protein CC2G_000605 [Coprinopsis cinerea AmutBmut pab1-1]|nr:hypothetical protein CC2G_000605 [Coprinopsis cinerea AmutBmut pab1-1]
MSRARATRFAARPTRLGHSVIGRKRHFHVARAKDPYLLTCVTPSTVRVPLWPMFAKFSSSPVTAVPKFSKRSLFFGLKGDWWAV